MVQISKCGIESLANLLALKRAGGGVNRELGESRRYVNGSGRRRELLVCGITREELAALLGDEGNVAAESGRCEAEFDKL